MGRRTRGGFGQHENEPWAVSGIVLYEALVGVVHGYIGGDVAAVRQAVTSSMDVLDVTERTAVEAAELQQELTEYDPR